jgi:DNA-binding response OmpR family regulator
VTKSNPGRAPRVLVVEDEMLVAMLLEDMLAGLGYEVIGPAARLDEARRLLAREAIDAAILDVNLEDESSIPLAEELQAQGTPFLFATGYGAHVLPERFKGVPVLRKPFAMADLARTLATALASRASMGS